MRHTEWMASHIEHVAAEPAANDQAFSPWPGAGAARMELVREGGVVPLRPPPLEPEG